MRKAKSNKTHSGRKNIHIIFRMDDYSALSNTGLELKILEQFEKRRLSLTFGVIPFVCHGDQKDLSPQSLLPLTQEKGDLLKNKVEKGWLDVALHGHSHQVNNLKNPSEFAGLDYEVQKQRLRQGKKFLENITGARVNSFVPPWNTYDLSTLKALEHIGFITLSAGWKGVAEKESGIKFLPATCGLNDLQDAIKASQMAPDDQPVIVVLFHHYDFIEHEDERGSLSLHEFSNLLDWVISQEYLIVVSLSQADEFIEDLTSNRFLLLDKWRSLDRFLPSTLREKKPVLFYHEGSVFYKTLYRLAVLYSLFFLAFVFSSYFLASLFFEQFDFLLKPFLVVCSVTTMGVLAYALKGMDISPKGLAVSLAGIGSSIGLLALYIFR